MKYTFYFLYFKILEIAQNKLCDTLFIIDIFNQNTKLKLCKTKIMIFINF
jgi:hypothetical protein